MTWDTGRLYPGRCWGYLTYGTTMSDDPIHVPPRHRLDDTEVARFTVRGATWKGVLRVAESDGEVLDEG